MSRRPTAPRRAAPDAGSEYDVVTLGNLLPKSGGLSLACFVLILVWWRLLGFLNRNLPWQVNLAVVVVLATVGFVAGFRGRRSAQGALAAKIGMWLNLGAAASILIPAAVYAWMLS